MNSWVILRVVFTAAIGGSTVGCIVTDGMENQWAYTCPDGYGFTVEFSRDEDRATFDDGDQRVRLERAVSGSGSRYAADDLGLWAKGAGAMVQVDGQLAHQDCQGEPL